MTILAGFFHLVLLIFRGTILLWEQERKAKLYQTINSLKTKSVGEEWGAPRVGFGGEKIALNWA